MNYMKVVAQLLDLEIGEEFRIEGHSSNNIYRLTEENIEYLSCGHWFSISSTLNKLLNGEYKVAKMPILDDVEKRYLKGVIRPFRSDVEYIFRCENRSDKKEWIGIRFKSTLCEMYFPEYPAGTMYRGMVLNRKYSIEELGL